KFPRKQKYLLGERIERTALDFMGQLQRARYEGRKKATLLEANITFEQFKTLVRLALGLNLLSAKSYEHLSQYIAEIGRMLGGWMKSAAT
ncbi:MAG TPA: diversity-generating retroelement protein Avd, partial [archaeon]|nr:diversity-generating retroelement protein Avd [archaeon]